jgi:hypothetical protein
VVPVEAGAAPVEAEGSAGAVRRTAAADLRHAAAVGSCGVGVAVGPAASPAVGGQARAPAGTQAIAHATDHRHSFPEGTRSGNAQHTPRWLGRVSRKGRTACYHSAAPGHASTPGNAGDYATSRWAPGTPRGTPIVTDARSRLRSSVARHPMGRSAHSDTAPMGDRGAWPFRPSSPVINSRAQT